MTGNGEKWIKAGFAELARSGFVEPEILVHRYLYQRRQIEYAGNRIAGRDEVGWRCRVLRRPVGRHQSGGEVTASRRL